jgi:DNA-binding NarL/FixJ family response regulator
MKRLLIIADHPFIVQRIRLALRQTAGFQVLGFLDGRRPMALQLAELRPDVVLIDEMRDPDDVLGRLADIADERPEAMVLLLKDNMDAAALDTAFAAGADAVLSRDLHPLALGTVMRETVRGTVIHRHQYAQPAARDCPLTAREAEVLGLAAQGFTNGHIAGQLWITEQTVKFHLSKCYRKLGVANRTEASRYAFVHLHSLVTADESLAS